MNIAIVTINQENAAIASWLAAQDFSGCTLAHWQIEPPVSYTHLTLPTILLV